MLRTVIDSLVEFVQNILGCNPRYCYKGWTKYASMPGLMSDCIEWRKGGMSLNVTVSHIADFLPPGAEAIALALVDANGDKMLQSFVSIWMNQRLPETNFQAVNLVIKRINEEGQVSVIKLTMNRPIHQELLIETLDFDNLNRLGREYANSLN